MKVQPERHEQLSIYDFIDESQEVPPSETVPQVDEAPSVLYPSSALDTITSEGATDKALVLSEPKFETNQIVTVKLPEELYFSATETFNDPKYWENFYYMQDWKGKQVRVLSNKTHPRKGFTYEVECVQTGKCGQFYEDELK